MTKNFRLKIRQNKKMLFQDNAFFKIFFQSKSRFLEKIYIQKHAF